jgi:HK97 family phage major capsid protein
LAGFFHSRKETAMTKLAQLREARDIKAREANALNDKYPADKRMEAADATKLDALLGEIEGIDAEIARTMKIDALGAPAAGSDEERARALAAATRTPGAHSNPEENKALKMFLQGGLTALTAEQRTAMAARVNPDIRAAMSTTTTTEGGYTTALEYQRSVEKALKEFGGMREVATVFQTATGMQLQFPTGDATSEVGEIVGQNAAVAAGDTTFGLVTLDVFKYSSKKIALPFELLQDTFIDIEAYIREVLQMRLGRIQNTHFTTGTGTGQPKGVVTCATSGKVGTTGQTTTVTYDDLVDLEHSIDPAYRKMGCSWMFNDATLKVIRKIKDSQNRPIFVPGYEQGNPGGAPDRLMGRAITINQDVATMAANAKSILFGHFPKYRIRDVMDLTLFRMTDSAFTLNGQVGFVAFMRSGGNLIDVSGSTVKFYQNSAT